MGRLKILATHDSPVREASGLCTAMLAGDECLAVVGDADNTVAWTLLVEGLPSTWRKRDLTRLPGIPADLGQLEAVADAGHGRLLVLGEEPALLVLIDPVAGECLGWWRITVTSAPDFADLWDRDENSRGEGLLPLAEGHVLILKEKAPVVAVECGPGGRRSPARPGDADPWSPPTGHELPVVHWTEVAGAPRDLSDVVAVDGRVIGLSDRDRCIVVLDYDDESFSAGEPQLLDKKIEKPEGLAVTSTGQWYVALDSRETTRTLVQIEAPDV